MWTESSDLFLKIGFWVVLAIGLLPSLYVFGIAIFASSLTLDYPDLSKIEDPPSRGGKFFWTQHVQLAVGSLKLQMFPRLWPAVLGSIGIAFLVTGIFVLLHVPTPPIESP